MNVILLTDDEYMVLMNEWIDGFSLAFAAEDELSEGLAAALKNRRVVPDAIDNIDALAELLETAHEIISGPYPGLLGQQRLARLRSIHKLAIEADLQAWIKEEA